MERIPSLTAETFDAAIQADTLSVTAFFAPWCAPCQRMEELLCALSAEVGQSVGFYQINADEQADLAERFSVHTLSAVLLFRSGCLVERTVGNKTKKTLLELIRGQQ